MAIYKSQYLDNANITTASLGAFLTSAGYEFTVEGDVTTIALSNKFSIVITKGTAGYNNFTFAIVVNGVNTSVRTVSRYMTLVSCKSDNMAFLQAYAGYDGYRAGILYEKINGQELYGAIGNNQSVFMSLTDFSLTDIDSSVVYTHGALLNYAAESGSIDFANNDCLFLSGVKSLNDPNFKACSTMTANTIITVQGKNCFVASAHSIFPYDT